MRDRCGQSRLGRTRSRRSLARAAAIVIIAALAIAGPPVFGTRAQDNDSGGSSMDNSDSVAANLPTLSVTAVPGYGNAPLTVGFFATAIDPLNKPFVSYLWNFGDGQVSMAPPLMFYHTYVTPGTYILTVTATTSDGRVATGFGGIVVRPPTTG